MLPVFGSNSVAVALAAFVSVVPELGASAVTTTVSVAVAPVASEPRLQARGLPFREDLVAPGDFTFASGYAAGERLLSGRTRPTAVFASNDDMAIGVLAAAQARGLKVPAELSVAGFDDSPTAAMVWPPLTTVRQPIAEMAAAATEMLIAGASRTARAETPVQQPWHCELVIRDSTAAPPA